jgi:hypothetical protein
LFFSKIGTYHVSIYLRPDDLELLCEEPDLDPEDLELLCEEPDLDPEDLELLCEEPDLDPENLELLCDELLLATEPEFLDPEENERAMGALIVRDEFEVIPLFERTFLLLLIPWVTLSLTCLLLTAGAPILLVSLVLILLYDLTTGLLLLTSFRA